MATVAAPCFNHDQRRYAPPESACPKRIPPNREELCREPNLVAGMAWLQSTYTIRLNHRHQLFGHVLSGRYKAQLVEGSGNGYLWTACDYAQGVAVPPVRARSN